jgi:hypothetical protein
MTNQVIRFLEGLGSNPVSRADFNAAVTLLEIDTVQRRALLDRDETALSHALGGRGTMRCLIFSGDDE